MNQPPQTQEREVLAGLVERVTFHNPENGFCVLRVKARGHRDLVTVVGHAAAISAGEWISASGQWSNDRTHGLQFRAQFLRASAPTTAEGIEKYLGSGLIRGIGPVTGRRLVRHFGTEVFDIIARLKEAGTTILLVEQNTRVALSVADDVHLLRGGQVRLSAPAAQVDLDHLHDLYFALDAQSA